MAEPRSPRARNAAPSGEPEDACARRIGTVIKGKWTLDGLLGVGGMAAVYAATHRNGQRAALKVLHIDFARDKAVCERFLREAYVSNKIGHPACVSVLDDDVTEEGEAFLIMELLEGQTLRDLWMNTGRRMVVPDVLRIVDPILDCLAACHTIGVIHRDLKPANIFLTRAGDVKVLDFGVAQFRTANAERTAAGTALGTPSYMSPEQAAGLVDQLDGRADLFSVGAIMHALMTGHRINKGRTENEALIMAATTPVPSVARLAPELPVEVIGIIDKALAWDRRNRFADAREMQRAVRATLDKLGGVPVSGPAAAATARAAQEVMARAAETAEVPAMTGVATSSKPAPRDAASAARQVVEEVVAADDPRVLLAADLFKRIERLLPSVRQLGWEHPATERTLRTAFEGIAEALRQDPKALDVSVRPYSFLRLGQTAWEPGPPFDAIPYNLFSSGMRRVRVRAGLTLEELRDLLTLLLLEPGRDLAPEDDVVAAFWEKALPHVDYDCVDAFAEGDAAYREAFFDEADSVERAAGAAARAHVDRLEARAMAIVTDRAALREKRRTQPMALDEVVRSVLKQQLDAPRERWSERYVDVLVEALVSAAKARDAAPLLSALRKSAADLVVAGRVEVVTQLHRAVIDRITQRLPAGPAQQLGQALTNALFGAETLELMLARLVAEPSRASAFEPVIAALSHKELPSVLAALRAEVPGPVVDLLLRYVERVLPGREAQLAPALAGMHTPTACRLMELLARSGTLAAREALAELAQSDDPAVRVEAKLLGAGGAEAAQTELAALAEHPAPLVRMAALRAMRRHGLRKQFPVVLRLAKAPTLHQLGSDERRELLATLLTLSLEHGEPTVVELARKGGVFMSEDRDATRVAAIEVLGEYSRSAAVAAVLREIAQSRWGTSDEARVAATAAAEAIGHRVAAGALA